MGTPNFRTTDAAWNGPVAQIGFQPDSINRCNIEILASDHAGDGARWQLVGTVLRVGDGVPEIVGTPKSLDLDRTVGAVTWDVRLVVNGDGANVDVRGALGVTVDWLTAVEQLITSEGSTPPPGVV